MIPNRISTVGSLHGWLSVGPAAASGGIGSGR